MRHILFHKIFKQISQQQSQNYQQIIIAINIMQIQQKFQSCFSYSPNWYSEQSIVVDPQDNDIIYYASNYLLYKYNRFTNRIIQQISTKSILKQYTSKNKSQQLNINQIQQSSLKLFSINLTTKFIILGLNDGIFIVIDKNFNYRLVQRLKCKNITHILILKQTEQIQLVVFDEIGVCIKLYISGQKITKMDLKIDSETEKKSRLKKVFMYENKIYCFYQKGTIYIFDQFCDKALRKLQFCKNQAILYVDILGNEVLMLTKQKQQLIINYFQIYSNMNYPLQHTKTIFEITKFISKCRFEIQYPKKYFYKRQQLKKSSICIKWYWKSKFLLTGKMGQIYLFDLSKYPKTNKITLKPFSVTQEQQQTLYECVPDPKHYKYIYQIYRVNNLLLMIGVDRILSFWNIENSIIDNQNSIKFLASRVKQIFYSNCQKNYAFILMDDSIIRSWEPITENTGSKLNQYWKIAQKYKIFRIISHPTQEGVVVLLTEDKKLIFYDLYEQRYIRIYDLEEQPSQLSYINSQKVPQLCILFDSQLTEIKRQFKQLYKKKLNQNFLVLLQLKTSFILVDTQKNTLTQGKKYFQVMENTQNVENLYIYQYQIFAFIQSKNTIRIKFINSNNQIKQINFEQKKFQFKAQAKFQKFNDQQLLIVALYYSKEIQLFIFDIHPSHQFKLLRKIMLSFTYIIENLIIHPTKNRILVYSAVNHTVQIWEFQKLFSQSILVDPKSKNIKAHFGNILIANFFNQNHLITCSQDHNIKIWDLNKIVEKDPPKPKKKRNKKKNKKDKKNINEIEEQMKNQKDQQEEEINQAEELAIQNKEMQIQEIHK